MNYHDDQNKVYRSDLTRQQIAESKSNESE
jgi:hypothetical protein